MHLKIGHFCATVPDLLILINTHVFFTSPSPLYRLCTQERKKSSTKQLNGSFCLQTNDKRGGRCSKILRSAATAASRLQLITLGALRSTWKASVCSLHSIPSDCAPQPFLVRWLGCYPLRAVSVFMPDRVSKRAEWRRARPTWVTQPPRGPRRESTKTSAIIRSAGA